MNIVHYFEGRDPKDGVDGHVVRRTHSYAMTDAGETWPMCDFGWNRGNGESFSVVNGPPGSRGTCAICARNIGLLKPPVTSSKPHWTRW